MEKIEEILAGDKRVVVFSRFLDMLSLLERAMQERSIRYIRIDGSTDNRQQLIDLFNDYKAQVALCSLLTAGHGINLTAANHVIHADRWWNPAVEDKATNRVHRIGQNRTVYVHRIITGGTLEERLNKLLARKRDMAGRIIDAAGGPMGSWRTRGIDRSAETARLRVRERTSSRVCRVFAMRIREVILLRAPRVGFRGYTLLSEVEKRPQALGWGR